MPVLWTRRAVADLRGLENNVRQRIRDAVNRYADTGLGDVRRLRGYDREWRLRVGQWRVRFTYDDNSESITILILRVLHRREAYRN